jgi:D-beta-D-heptose 7-phosphate kinase/D-beta-D-heptose 1-phosphate adenosyltransferase
VLCVGDVMLDRFVYGDIERISPEAPVPILRLTRTREMLGGTGNVANNVAALGGTAILVGLVGADAAGAMLRREIGGLHRIEAALVETGYRPTICKTRFVASRQQIVRADDESQLALQASEEAELLQRVEAGLDGARAVILSDYGKGVLSTTLVARAVALARAANVPVFVDPKTDDFRRYRGASCITPNLKELAAAAKLPVRDEAEIVAAARRVMEHAEAQAILTTRSEKGMILVEADGQVHSVPARAREVFDVSGAGDTVVATMALAHASGRSLAHSIHIANAAAGVVVSKFGTATADIAEVLHELDEQNRQEAGTPGALLPLARVESLVARWKEQGLTVGFTNGCFDIVHSGHISLLAAARAQCDRLLVGLNTDASVRGLKGPTRPIHALEKRAQVIAAIRYVDGVMAFDDPTPIDLIRRLLPDVLIKGADYTADGVVGGDIVTAAGGRIYLAPLVAGESTTGVVSRIHETASAPG